MAIFHRIHRVMRRPIGATAVEYIVALILVALVVLATIRVFGSTIKGRFDASSGHISTMDKKQEYLPATGTVASADGKDVKGSAQAKKTEEERQQELLAKEAQKRQKVKINPIIIVIFLFLIGLMVFVVIRGNSYN